MCYKLTKLFHRYLTTDSPSKIGAHLQVPIAIQMKHFIIIIFALAAQVKGKLEKFNFKIQR